MELLFSKEYFYSPRWGNKKKQRNPEYIKFRLNNVPAKRVDGEK